MDVIYDLRGLTWPDWLREHWLSVGGSQCGHTEPTVSQVLYALAIANKPPLGLTSDPYTIVETGIHRGATACWLAMAAKYMGGRYMGFDMQAYFVDLVNNLFKTHDLDSNARAHCGLVPEIVEINFEQTSIDLLFVDDDHRAEHVEREIKAFWPLIKPGGLMAFHDVLGGFPIWDMIKPMGAMKLVSVPFNPVGQATFGGLGVVRKPTE